MKTTIEKSLIMVKKASLEIAKVSNANKKKLLISLAECLREHREEIMKANLEDVRITQQQGASGAFIDRLTLNEKGFSGMIQQLEMVAFLDDPNGEIIEQRTLPNGILLKKMRFPLGVVLMIYESRPNVTVDVAGLCLKSGNAVVLKGGSEALNTNKALIKCIHTTLRAHKIPESAVTFLESVNHETVEQVLKRNDLIDVVIPRGNYSLTSAVAEKSRIPILYHASGGARMYIDKSADIKQALEVCVNAKTNRIGVCNALDCVLVHKAIAEKFLNQLDKMLIEKSFESRADIRAKRYMMHAKTATAEDFATEFLDSILAVKVVDNVEEALTFIKRHTHHHTEILAAKDKSVITMFINEIDAAGIMINCSSRFHDGGEFGMGAEMGTATGKLHARGPVSVKELTTYKWIAYGSGQIKK